MTKLEAALLEVAAVLQELTIPYMLIGGLATGIWGEGRSTLDADFSLWVEPENVPDLVFASRQAERNVIARAVPKIIHGFTIMVASVEDLIWMKLISERQKDIDDATRLLRRFARTLDRSYLEPRLREISEGFARADILEIYHQELEKHG
jgi:hypothetical protein